MFTTSNRDEFDRKLRQILGSTNTFFQPPESVKIKYPCFVYEFSKDHDLHADDMAYLTHTGYDVTAITKDPDVTYKNELKAEFRHCEWVRSFISDNLNHNIYKIYF